MPAVIWIQLGITVADKRGAEGVSSGKRAQTRNGTRAPAAISSASSNQDRYGYSDGAKGEPVPGTGRACRSFDCRVNERSAAGRAGFFRRGGAWARLAGSTPVALRRHGDEAGLRGCGPESTDGCVQKSVFEVGNKNRAGSADGGRLHELAAIFKSSAHYRETAGVRSAADRE